MRFLVYAVAFGLPILDIATLVEVGARIGAWPTTGLVLLSATIGVMLVRAQGFAILAQARATLNRGSFPAREVFDGACVLIGGALLALPGFASDLLGIFLLLPPARSLVCRVIARYMRRSGRFATRPFEPPPARRPGAGPVIEGEYESVEPATEEKRRRGENDDASQSGSPWRR
jgi:UPF0716 protein FxsA